MTFTAPKAGNTNSELKKIRTNLTPVLRMKSPKSEEYEEIKRLWEEYNSKLNPRFDGADTEHVLRFVARVLNKLTAPTEH